MAQKKNWNDKRWQGMKDTFFDTKHLKILVKISWYYSKDGEHIEASQHRWVTSVNYATKEFMFDVDKKALEWESLQAAAEFIMAAAANGFNASVVLLPDWTTEEVFFNRANKQDKWAAAYYDKAKAAAQKKAKKEEKE